MQAAGSFLRYWTGVLGSPVLLRSQYDTWPKNRYGTRIRQLLRIGLYLLRSSPILQSARYAPSPTGTFCIQHVIREWYLGYQVDRWCWRVVRGSRGPVDMSQFGSITTLCEWRSYRTNSGSLLYYGCVGVYLGVHVLDWIMERCTVPWLICYRIPRNRKPFSVYPVPCARYMEVVIGI